MGLQGTSAQRHIQGMWRHQRDPGVKQDLRDLAREIVRGRAGGGEGARQGHRVKKTRVEHQEGEQGYKG